MSVPDDKQTSTPQDILKPPFDLALHLGLKPYAEFEKKMSSVIERITADERERFLRDIYRLAAKKVLMETARDDAENLARQLSEEAEKLQQKNKKKDAPQKKRKARTTYKTYDLKDAEMFSLCDAMRFVPFSNRELVHVKSNC